jgi:putative SOS response-associated peptidase YedK
MGKFCNYTGPDDGYPGKCAGPGSFRRDKGIGGDSDVHPTSLTPLSKILERDEKWGCYNQIKMCGRYAFKPKSEDDFFDRFEIVNRDIRVGTSFNVAPGATVPVVTMNSPKQLVLMKWGLIPVWAKDEKISFSTINARSEEIETKPAFRNAFKSHRCLVPASGFYEWKKVSDEGKMVKIPYWIRLKTEETFGFAGLYENNTFSIVTTTANEIMQPIHNRMPVILKKENEEKWLDNSKYSLEELKNLMIPYPASEMITSQISARVNSPKNNDEELIKPLGKEKLIS